MFYFHWSNVDLRWNHMSNFGDLWVCWLHNDSLLKRYSSYFIFICTEPIRKCILILFLGAHGQRIINNITVCKFMTMKFVAFISPSEFIVNFECIIEYSILQRRIPNRQNFHIYNQPENFRSRKRSIRYSRSWPMTLVVPWNPVSTVFKIYVLLWWMRRTNLRNQNWKLFSMIFLVSLQHQVSIFKKLLFNSE